MKNSTPYVRSFAIGAIWFAAVGVRMISRHNGHWSTYPFQNLMVLVGAWIVTGLLLGVAATYIAKLRSWWGIGLITIPASMVVMWLMVFAQERIYGPAAVPEFKTTDEMMVHFAKQATQWVKKDRGVDLDFSFESIHVIEEELERISKEVDKTNPQRGTFGLACVYGAYVGEVLRRKEGGTWSADHAVGGPKSYPLAFSSDNVIFPVGWCWKRLTGGEDENVYVKAQMWAQVKNGVTNSKKN